MVNLSRLSQAVRSGRDWFSPVQGRLWLPGLLLTGSLLALPGTSAAFEKEEKEKEINAIISDLSQKDSIDKAWLEKAFAGAVFKQRIIELISKPAEHRLTWGQYRNLLISEHRIREGAKFWDAHRRTLENAQEKWGVPASIIVGILGIETGYGANTGGFRVMDALYTLGLGYPRRAPFFKKELKAFLRLAYNQDLDPLSLTGSYAGAMGLPQFMPSSYLAYAVSFDEDPKKIDIWSSVPDAIGSVAAYLQRHGWKKGLPVALQAQVSGSAYKSFVSKRSLPKKTLRKARQLGWKPEGQASAKLPASLPVRGLELTADDKGRLEYWLTTKNFYALTRYNTSDLYAMAVWQLGQEVERRRAADTGTPVQETASARSEPSQERK